MNTFGLKIKTEYEYEYYSVFEKHRIIRFLNIFGPNYSNIFEYRIIRSPLSSVSPGGADRVRTARDWPAWVGFMVTTHCDLVSGPFHSPIFIGLHSLSISANMYHLNTRAGELPLSASSHFAVAI